MSMIWKDPFETALMPLRDVMNRLFEESYIWPGRLENFTGRTFPIDVYEAKDQQGYIVEASLPGVKPDDVHITAVGDTLTIRVSTKSEEKIEKPTYVRRERYIGELYRSFTLPTKFDAEKIEATFEHGILKLTVPKVEAEKPKQVSIKVKELAGAGKR